MTEVPRVAFVTLGCKVNQAEADAIASAVVCSGATIVAEQDADVVVITTCTVTGEADRKARKAVHYALRLPRAPRVVVTGCMAAVSGDVLAALGERVMVEADKDRVPARVHEALSRSAGAAAATASAGAGDTPDPAARSRTRAQVKVEDGCDAFCTYCIVPYARGVPRSVPLDVVVKQVAGLVATGVAEVVLTGINIGRYDSEGARLGDLVEAIAATGVLRIRLSSIEPGDVSERLLSVAAATPAFCRHLHVPLQSGSDGVLSRMGRPYTIARYAEVLAAARTMLPGVAVTTDVIAGFPGETPEEWEETLAFVENAEFSRLHVFRYSRRTGTPAASMSGQVAPQAIAARAAALRQLGAGLVRRHAESRVGTIAEALIERVLGDAPDIPVADGILRDYSRVVVPSGRLRPGDVVPVRIESVDASGCLIGRVETA